MLQLTAEMDKFMIVCCQVSSGIFIYKNI